MRILFLLLIAALAGGCGYKGPLTLPQSKTAASKPAAAPQPAPARTAPSDTTAPTQ